MIISLIEYVLVYVVIQLQSTQGKQMNVLLITVDDLRPELGFYVNQLPHKLFSKSIKTPNLDWLASKSAVFTRAFAQYPLCNPSRSSFLTGRYPRATHVLKNEEVFEKFVTLSPIPHYFKNSGYMSINEGKVFHAVKYSGRQAYWNEEIRQRLSKGFPWKAKTIHKTHFEKSWNILPPLANNKTLYSEEYIALKVAHYLKKIKEDKTYKQRPFFMAVGFTASHEPFDAPPRFFDLYPADTIGLAPNSYYPKMESPDSCCRRCPVGLNTDINSTIYNVKRNPEAMQSAKALELRRAYYSAISYLDHNVGIILQALSETHQLDSTVIAFVADHGQGLGENNHWCKSRLLDIALNVPLLISAPHLSTTGTVVHDIVELVDLYPTLLDLAGLRSLPKCSSNSQTDCLDGVSLAGVFRNTSPGQLKQKKTALSTVLHRLKKTPTNSSTDTIGLSLRTKNYRYNLWLTMERQTLAVDWEHALGAELFHLRTDPEHNVNVHGKPVYENVTRYLNTLLRQEWDRDVSLNDGKVAGTDTSSDDSQLLTTHLYLNDAQKDERQRHDHAVLHVHAPSNGNQQHNVVQFKYYEIPVPVPNITLLVLLLSALILLIIFRKSLRSGVPCFCCRKRWH